MARRSATVHLSFWVDGDRYESAFPLTPGRHWSRFKSPGLPHLAGAHLYVSLVNGSYVCALRANNGTLEPDGSWRGVFAFSDVKLEVRGAGEWHTEAPFPESGTWTFLPRAAFRFRFVVGTNISALYLQNHLSWEPLLGDYGPTESELPDVTEHADYYRDHYGMAYGQELNAPAALFRPTGVPGAEKDGMAPGGDGIFPDGHGYPACREYVLHARWMLSRWLDRIGPIYLFDSKGRQLGPHSFPAPLLPAEVQVGKRNTNRDLPPFLTMEKGWGSQEYRRLTPDAGEALWDWQELATSHLIRAIHHGIAAWEFTGDAMVRDDLVAVFQARVMLDWQHRADCPIQPVSQQGWWPDSLTNTLARAQSKPMHGAPIDRAAAWIAYLGAQCARMGHSSAVPWLKMWSDLIETSATEDGINNVLYAPAYMPENVLGTQLFHDALIKWAYFAVHQQLDTDPSPLLRRWVNRVLDNPAFTFLPYTWNAAAQGPRWWAATQVDGQQVRLSDENATGCGKPGWSTGYGGCIEHILPVCAATYRASKDPAVLAIALKVWVPHATNAERLAWLKEATEKNWKSECQAVLEAL